MKAQTGKSKKHLITVVLCIAAALVFTSVSHAGIEEHIVKTETGFYYTVQKGDTLWDLSEKFADSPWKWPDLWHYNPDIENPHRIYPGQKIQIYKKTFYDKKPAEKKETPAPEVKHYFDYSKIAGVGFIRQEEADHSGVLFRARRESRLISTDARVYIHPCPGASMAQGQRFFLYRPLGPIRDPETNEYIGIQHLLTGVVEITKVSEDFAVGRITNAFRAIQEGDKLIPFMHRDPKIELKPGVAGLNGKIIKSEEGWKILGDQMIAFIDKGRMHGIKVGQKYEVLARIMQKDPSGSPRELERETVGSLIVLHTENRTATVLIANAREDLNAGMPVQAMR